MWTESYNDNMDKYITCPADIIAANGSVCITACIYYSMQC